MKKLLMLNWRNCRFLLGLRQINSIKVLVKLENPPEPRRTDSSWCFNESLSNIRRSISLWKLSLAILNASIYFVYFCLVLLLDLRKVISTNDPVELKKDIIAN